MAAWTPCRCLLRIHTPELIAKISRKRNRQVTNYGRQAMGTSLYRREHDFPNVYSGVARRSSSRKTKSSRRKNLSSEQSPEAIERARQRVREQCWRNVTLLNAPVEAGGIAV